MPRKPRINLPGYHHIINRGVNRSDIYETDEDYEMFLKIRKWGQATLLVPIRPQWESMRE